MEGKEEGKGERQGRGERLTTVSRVRDWEVQREVYVQEAPERVQSAVCKCGRGTRSCRMGLLGR